MKARVWRLYAVEVGGRRLRPLRWALLLPVLCRSDRRGDLCIVGCRRPLFLVEVAAVVIAL
jgi:hypothetical protein